MIRCHRIGLFVVQPVKLSNLVFQNIEHQFRVQFRIIHMPGLQTTVLIMLYKMMVRIAGKSQGVQPQRINGSVDQLSQTRAGRRQVWQIMAQDVMPDQMICCGQPRLQLIQPRVYIATTRPYRHRVQMPDRGEVKDLGRAGINFQIDRNAFRQKCM